MVRKRNKYGNIKTEVDGILFHSRKEAARYEVLRDLAAAGLVTDLRLQVSFTLHSLGGKAVCRYISDFCYIEDGHAIVEDVKGRLTPLYKLKAKMMQAEYGITVKET